jgi:hypothetical protein
VKGNSKLLKPCVDFVYIEMSAIVLHQSAMILCSFTNIFVVRFPVQDIKGHMMDIRTADGSIVKISAPGNGDQELTKTLGVEMVQNMYKVKLMLVYEYCLNT